MGAIAAGMAQVPDALCVWRICACTGGIELGIQEKERDITHMSADQVFRASLANSSPRTSGARASNR